MADLVMTCCEKLDNTSLLYNNTFHIHREVPIKYTHLHDKGAETTRAVCNIC